VPGQALSWKARFRVDKYHEDATPWYDRDALAEFHATHTPYEVREGEDNLLLNAGIALLEDLLIGAGGTTYVNANARLGTGDSVTAAVASQTGLQAATNKLMQACDATFPSRAGQTLTFKTTFLTGAANWHWQEWVIDNGATALNRKVEDLGTKVSGTWALTVTIVIS
jgi:hypothetical protein